MVPARDREHPSELVAVGADAREGRRIVDRHPGLPKRLRVAAQVVGLHAEVHETAARLERRPPLVRGIVLVERDQLHVRAVAERDERVVGADGMATAGHDREAERRVALPGGREVGNRDDDVVDASEHQRPPNAGATSPRKRLS